MSRNYSCTYCNFSRCWCDFMHIPSFLYNCRFFPQVLFIGGSTPQMLKYLEIECHIGKEDASVLPDEDEVKIYIWKLTAID